MARFLIADLHDLDDMRLLVANTIQEAYAEYLEGEGEVVSQEERDRFDLKNFLAKPKAPKKGLWL